MFSFEENFSRIIITSPNHAFEKLVVNTLHRKIRVNNGFCVSKVVTSTQDKKKDKERGKSTRKSKIFYRVVDKYRVGQKKPRGVKV